MAVEISYHDEFVIIRTNDNANVSLNLAIVYELIEEHIKKECKVFAFGFANLKFLYSKEIAMLISCIEHVKLNHGTVVFIEITNEISDLINIIDFEGDILYFKTEQDLISNSFIR